MALPRSLRRIGSLALVLAATGLTTAAGAPQPAVQAQAATITISLTSGGIQVSPNTASVRRGETIQWQSELPFAIAVERNSALFGRTLPPQALRGRANTPVRAAVGESAPTGSYKYSVAVWDGTNVWVVDPEILILPNE